MRGLFSSLSGSQLLKLDQEKIPHEYERGQVLFYEGNPALAVYCICSGVVKLYKTGKQGKRLLIRLLGPGELVGYRAIVADEPYAATAEAVETTTVCTITGDTLRELLQTDSDLAKRLMVKLAEELRISENQYLERTQDPVRQRTARFLIWVLAHLQNPSKSVNTIDLPLLREDMAQMIGTAPETLSRVFREFSREKLIVLDRKSIVLSKLQALRRIATKG
jgi:CRP/FNR family transcriptional regulator, polysaccharide utilization system transcription regulator